MARTLPDRIRISAPVTPFSEKGDFMEDAFAEMIRWHVRHGTRGFLVAGDNGEHWALSTREIRRIAEITTKESGGRMPVYVGAWAITEREAIERAAAAAEGGAYGLCVKPQSYVHSWAPATEADVVGRFEAVAKAVPLPMMIYNSYNRTGVNISHEVLHRICDVADAECLKDTNGDANFLMGRVLQFHDKLSVLVGGNFFYTGMLLGAGGAIGTVLDLFGDEADRMFEFETMTPEERREHIVKNNEIGHAINYFGTIPAAYKAAWNMMGLPAGRLRDPLKPISAEQEAKLRAVLEKWGVPLAGAASPAAMPHAAE
jgi:4-hydroxy-tetrahydrodipicolinate synthase